MTTSVQSKNSILLICTSVKGGRKRDIGDRAVLGVAKQETQPLPCLHSQAGEDMAVDRR